MGTKQHVLVCVTGQRNCERLIRHSASLAELLSCPVSVVHAAASDTPFMGGADTAEALEHLYRISKKYNAEMTIIKSTNVIETVADHAKTLRATHIVTGGPAVGGTWSFLRQLQERLQGAEFFIIPSDVQEGFFTDNPRPGASVL